MAEERKSLAVTGVRREEGEKEEATLKSNTAGSERVALVVREDSNNGRPVNTGNIVILLTDLPLNAASDLTAKRTYVLWSAANTSKLRFCCLVSSWFVFFFPPLWRRISRT